MDAAPQAAPNLLLKPVMPVGIIGYGAYVPQYRLPAVEIARVWKGSEGGLPVKEKAVPGLDEDVITMSIEAARNALARAGINPEDLRAVWVGSESHPYAVKPSGTVVAEAIGASVHIQAGDWEFACKAGSEAFVAAMGLVGSGMGRYALAIGMDTAQGRPGDALEFTAGAGGAAFIIGPAAEALAEIEGSYSYVTDTPDFWRREGKKYPEHGQRFTGEPAYFKHISEAGKAYLEASATKPEDYTFAVFHQPNAKFPQRVAGMLGFKPEQIKDGLLVPMIGNTYAGAALIGLTAILDIAKPGDRILVVTYGSGSGSDAIGLQVTDAITDRRGQGIENQRLRYPPDTHRLCPICAHAPQTDGGITMTEVVIAGMGMTPVGEHWELSLRNLATRAILAAQKDAGGLKPQALYIGNFLGSMISHQANLGALLTDNSGLTGIEAYTVEAAEASGAAAFRMAYLAVASGFVDVAMALGVEKMTDVTDGQESALATGLDFDYEGMQGVTPVVQAALLMQRYMHQYGVSHDVFNRFPLLAHANAVHNPNAMYRKALKPEVVQAAEKVSDPLTLYDIAPYADGAAAVILTRSGLLPKNPAQAPVRVLGSSVITDSLALYDRDDPLRFDAARLSVEQACRQAGILPTDVNLFELDDFSSIYAVLALEAAGFALPGEGWHLAENGHVPMVTLGGSKARGNPVGATGMYQVCEAVTQLRGQAGAAQVKGAQLAMVQTLGGPASTAITHVLKV